MNDTDYAKLLEGRPEHKAAGFACAVCERAPSCPMLHDALWSKISPGHNYVCRCGHSRSDHARVPGRPCLDATCAPACEGYCPILSDLLCWECAEIRLGRPLELADLSACLFNLKLYRVWRVNIQQHDDPRPLAPALEAK